MSDYAPLPNFSQVPNCIFDQMCNMGNAEYRIVSAIVRQTYGWHKDRDIISLSQLEQLTGLSRQGVIDGTEAAIRNGYVKRVPVSGNRFSYEIIIPEDDADSQASRPDDGLKTRPHDTNQSSSLTSSSQASRPKVVKLVDTQNKDKEIEIKDIGDSANRTSPSAEKSTRKPRTAKPERTEEEQAILNRKKVIESAYVSALGYTPAAFGREAKAAKWLAQHNYTPDQVVGCLRSLQQDAFYSGKHVSLETVAKQIGAYVQKATWPVVPPPAVVREIRPVLSAEDFKRVKQEVLGDPSRIAKLGRG